MKRVLFIVAALALVLGGTADTKAGPILKIVTFQSPATASNVTLHAGSGDENEKGTADLGISTALRPTLANWNSTFIAGNFDGTAPTTQTFQSTFNNWNTAQGANFGGNWVIKNGGNLDVTFTVTDIASASPTLGGIGTFTISITNNAGYVGPALGQLVWSQALYDSYSTQPPYKTDLAPPLNTLDTYSSSKGNTGSGGAFTRNPLPIPGQNPGPNNTTPSTIGANPFGFAYADPIYPFQNGAKRFSDGPQAYWPDESFRAIALLSTVTFKTDATGKITERDLTVYNGVDWGFDLSVVPEPSSLTLLGIGVFGFFGYGWRQRRRKVA